MLRTAMSFAFLANLLFFSACAGGPQTRMGTDPELPDNLKVDANAYGSDHFTFAKRMKSRPANDYIFYSKHCNLIARRDPNAFYLQSEYGCTPLP